MDVEILTVSKPVFVAQVISIALGIIDFGLTVTSYQKWPDEEFFLAIVVISLFAVCACAIGDKLYRSETTKLIDMIAYCLCGGTLALASIVMVISVVTFSPSVENEESQDESSLDGQFVQRIIAAVLGFLNGTVLCFMGLVILRELQNSIFPINVTQKKLIVFDWDRVKSSNITGKVQVAILVVGFVDVILTAHSYLRYTEETVFLAIVIICFVLSFMEFCGGALGFTSTEDASAFISLAIAHCIGGVVLLSGGIVMIVAVVGKSDNGPSTNCNRSPHCSFAPLDERIASGALAVLSGCLYSIAAFALYQSSKSVHDVTQYDWDYEDYNTVPNE